MALLGLASMLERLFHRVFLMKRQGVSFNFLMILFAVTLVTLGAYVISGWWVIHPLIGAIAFLLVMVQSFKYVSGLRAVYEMVPEWAQEPLERLSVWGVFFYLLLVYLDKIF